MNFGNLNEKISLVSPELNFFPSAQTFLLRESEEKSLLLSRRWLLGMRNCRRESGARTAKDVLVNWITWDMRRVTKKTSH